jgi:D-glycerate 3-kinase
VSFPRFDKAADDRAPPDRWDQVRGPLDVLLFEGWCVGARPQAPADLATPVNDLERSSDPDGTWRAWVDAQLAGRYRPLFARVDLLALLAAPDFSVVERWRGEQEAELRERLLAEGRPDTTQSDTELRRFIQHYERLTRHILAEMPGRADVVVRLDGARRPAPYPTS